MNDSNPSAIRNFVLKHGVPSRTDRRTRPYFRPCKGVEQLLYFVQHWEVAMAMRTRTSTETEEHIALKRNRLVLEQARAVGLLGEAKNTRLSGRVPAGLIEAEKKRAHVSSDTELLELALSRLALEDDFGARLVRRKGSVPADIDLAI